MINQYNYQYETHFECCPYAITQNCRKVDAQSETEYKRTFVAINASSIKITMSHNKTSHRAPYVVILLSEKLGTCPSFPEIAT